MPRTPEVCLPEFCPQETIDGLPVLPYVRLTVTLLRLSTFDGSLVTKGLAATLSDGLTDQAGAVVPGANMAVINVAQGFARRATANEQGIFVVALFPGKGEMSNADSGALSRRIGMSKFREFIQLLTDTSSLLFKYVKRKLIAVESEVRGASGTYWARAGPELKTPRAVEACPGLSSVPPQQPLRRSFEMATENGMLSAAAVEPDCEHRRRILQECCQGLEEVYHRLKVLPHKTNDAAERKPGSREEVEQCCRRLEAIYSQLKRLQNADLV